MLNLFRKKSSEDQPITNTEKSSWFSKLSMGLRKTRHKFSEQVANLFLGKKQIDADLLESLETLLITADVGVSTTNTIIQNLTQKVARNQLQDSEALFAELKNELCALLKPCEKPIDVKTDNPFVVLMVGINGAGKTTTLGKLAHYFQKQGNSILLAAGDTFRAAAVEQLQTWGQRNQIDVIAQKTGADSASVLYDAVQAAKARKIDVLLADTAGRLHNKNHLMDELKKIKRVIQKADTEAPQEIILVLDASIGQNALNQVKEFHELLGVTGLIVTKLDGSAKGGIVFAIAERFKLPITFIGVGEGLEDLQPFVAEEFVQALFE